MDYKRLCKLVYETRFRRQKKATILEAIVGIEVKCYVESISQQFKFDSDCLKYMKVYYEFKRRFLEEETTHSMSSHIGVRRIFDELFEDAKSIKKEKELDIIFVDKGKIYPIIEAGLNLATDSERKFLYQLAEELKISTEEML